MDENRFDRVFESHDICAFSDAPIWVMAYALLRDTNRKTLIAQVKLKSLSDQPISEVVLDVRCWDQENVPLPGVTGFSMHNLEIARDEVFGQKTPIVVPNNRTHMIAPVLIKIVFSDGSIWEGVRDTPVDTVQAQVHLIDIWNNDAELIHQFHIETKTQGEYLPDKTGRFWRCSCGEINALPSETCFACGAEKEVLFTTLSKTEWLADMAALRLEEEHIQKLHQSKNQKNRPAPCHHSMIEQKKHCISTEMDMLKKKSLLSKVSRKPFIPKVIILCKQTWNKMNKMVKLFCIVIASIIFVSLVFLSVFFLGPLHVQYQLKSHNNYYYVIDDYSRYQLNFNKNTAKITYQEYEDNAWSPSGKLLRNSIEKSFSYNVISDNQIEIDGVIYTFEFYKLNHVNNAKGLRFDSLFLGISSVWP